MDKTGQVKGEWEEVSADTGSLTEDEIRGPCFLYASDLCIQDLL